MNCYLEMAEAYERDADNLSKVIEKYKAQLGKKKNREELNAKIYELELIYHEMIGNSKRMKKMGEKYES